MDGSFNFNLMRMTCCHKVVSAIDGCWQSLEKESLTSDTHTRIFVLWSRGFEFWGSAESAVMSAFKRKAQQQKLRYALALLDDNTPDAEEELLTLIKEAKPEFDNEREVAKG